MTPTLTLHEGDNRETLRRLIDQGVRVHSVVCDPPYGLTSVTKRFGGDTAAPAKFGTDGAFSRASGGFMGSKWDGTGIERDPEFWRLIWEILLPGGYCLAFSSPRTGHWQACAMDVAGFVMHPFLGWLYGSGFPKAHNAAMAIDKQLGVESGFVAEGDPIKRMIPGAQQNATGDWTKTDERQYQPGRRVPGSPEAAEWDGWAYGAQTLKPALEPIYVGQKPFSEKNGALNLLKHGVGAINIDGCRVPLGPNDPLQDGVTHDGRALDTADTEGAWGFKAVDRPPGVGRHPANLLHDGSAEVVALFPQSQGQIARSSSSNSATRKNQNTYGEMKRGSAAGEMQPRGDAGSAARFFNALPFSDAERDYLDELGFTAEINCDAIRYQAKAGKADRAGSTHPTVKPVALMRWLCRLVTPPGGVILDPFAGSGTTGEAARQEGFDCILMEAEARYAADIKRRFDMDVGDPLAFILGVPEDDALLHILG